METTHRPSAPAHSRIGRLVTAALALGTVSAAALTVGAAGAASSKQVTLVEQNVNKMGKVLFVNGKAVYFIATPGSPCDASCLKIWPALTLSSGVNSATAGRGVQHSKLGTTTGLNGVKQVTYSGKPLYFFSLDSKGKVKGNISDQWGKWSAVVVAKAPSSSGSSSSSGSGSGGTNAGSGGASF